MIIQCSECETRFKVADDKLKPGGIKVRCSKCRHIFKVMPPEPEPLPPSEPADESEIDFGAFNMQPVTEEQTSVAAPPPAEDKAGQETPAGLGKRGEEEATPESFDEMDLTGKGPGGVEEEPSRQGLVEFDFEEESPGEKGPSDFDAKEETPGRQGLVEFDFEEEGPGESGLTEFDFEEGGPGESGPTEFDFEEEDSSGAGEFSFEDDEPFFEETTDASWDAEATAGPSEDFEFGEEKGETAEVDDFDLSGMNFGEDESAPTVPGDTEDFGNIALERNQGKESLSVAAPQSREPSWPAASKTKDAALAAPALPRRKGPFKGLLTFVLLLLLALCGAAGYFYWQRGELNIEHLIDQLTGQGAPAPVAGQIRLTDLSSAFVTNREAGQMFVIRGQAVNDYPDTRSAIAVKGILYDKAGKALLQQTVFCGNPLDTSSLRNLPFAKIEESMNNQFGDSLSNLNVGPGKSIPFTIVFKNLPSELAEFTVETADSKPGSKP